MCSVIMPSGQILPHGSSLYGKDTLMICFSFYFLKIYLFIYLLALLGLRCCTRAFSSCGKRGYSLLWCAGVSLRWLLFVAEHGL